MSLVELVETRRDENRLRIPRYHPPWPPPAVRDATHFTGALRPVLVRFRSELSWIGRVSSGNSGVIAPSMSVQQVKCARGAGRDSSRIARNGELSGPRNAHILAATV